MTKSLTIQEMIDQVIADADDGAMAKLAEEAETAQQRGGQKSKEDIERKADKEEAQQGGGQPEGYSEKTAADIQDSVYIEKMASAVEEIVSILTGQPIPSKVGKIAMIDSASPSVGAGKGPGASATNVDSPVSGEQSTETGEAKTKIPMKPPMESKGSGGNANAPNNAMATNAEMSHPPQPEAGVLKQGSLNAFLMSLASKDKSAEDAINKAKITASKTSALPEDQPSKMARPAEVTSQERLVSSNEAPAKATKREAKAVPKKRMGEVLDEPAQTKSTDKVLDAALGADKVNQAGAKIASARAWLAKIASEGCTCEKDGLEKGTCPHCKLKSRMQEKGPEKTSMVTSPSGAGSAVPSTVQPSAQGGAMAGGAPNPQM